MIMMIKAIILPTIMYADSRQTIRLRAGETVTIGP
jgi:hypothetical protein